MLAALIVTAALAAHANEDQFGRFPFVNDEGVVVGGATSWGIVFADDVYGGYGRVCEEALGPVVFFVLQQPARDNRLVVAGLHGLATSSDGGCSLLPIENDLKDAAVSAVYVDPADPLHLLLGTSTRDQDNGLWESFDGGDSVVPLRAPAAGVAFFALTAASDGRIAASGTDETGGNLVLWSVDGGASFVDVSPLWSTEPIARVLAFDDDIDDIDGLLVGGLQQDLRGFVDRAARAAPPQTTPTTVRLGTTPREVTRALRFRGDLYVLARNGVAGELLRADAAEESGFATIAGGPGECAFVVGDELYGCGKETAPGDPALFLHSPDGQTWTSAIAFEDVRYRTCPAGTLGQLNCDGFVAAFCRNLVADADGDPDCSSDECRFRDLCATFPDDLPVDDDNGDGNARPGAEQPACGASGRSSVASTSTLLLLLGLSLSHANGADFSLLARKNFCNLVDCWTSQVNAAGEPIASAFTATPVSAVSSERAAIGPESRAALDTAQVHALQSLAPASSAVTAAASTLQSMLDPRTTSIILKVLCLSSPPLTTQRGS